VRSESPYEDRAARLRTPQPVKTFTERLKLTGARERIPTLMYVAGSHNKLWERRPSIAKLREDDRWIWRELPCGHDLYVLPEETAGLIMEAASQ
jgi:hypothetical protein